jgi:hypothetical protein
MNSVFTFPPANVTMISAQLVKKSFLRLFTDSKWEWKCSDAREEGHDGESEAHSGFYTYRVVGGHRDHWDFGRAVAAGAEQGTNEGQAGRLC